MEKLTISPKDVRYQEVRERANSREIPIPKVNLYKLSEAAGTEAFVDALKQAPEKSNILPWNKQDPNEILLEALNRGILVDRLPSQLKDLASSKKIAEGKRKFVEKYPGKYSEMPNRFARRYESDWNYSTIAEFPWINGEGRFARILNEEAFDEVTTSRNQFVISDEAQKSLRETTFATIGMGVGTACTYLLALSGAKNFVVADGGIVKPHDSNRLIGSGVRSFDMNHTVHWMQMALDRNPYAKITGYPKNIGDSGVPLEQFLESANPDKKLVLLEVADNLLVKIHAREQSPNGVRMVTDVGLAGVYHFDAQGRIFQGRLSPDNKELIEQHGSIDLRKKTEIALQMVGLENVPLEYQKALQSASTAGAPFWPQPGIAAFLTAAMLVTALNMEASGVPVKSEATVNLYDSLRSQ